MDTCEKHPYKIIISRCKKHEANLCIDCLLQEHGGCIGEIEAINVNNDSTTALASTLVQKYSSISEGLDIWTRRGNGMLKSLKETETKLVKGIKAIRKQLLNQINVLATDALEIIKSVVDNEEDIVKNSMQEIQLINDRMVKLHPAITEMQEKSTSGDFAISSKKVMDVDMELNEIEQMYKQNQQSIRNVKLMFYLSKELENARSNLTTFGQLAVEDQDSEKTRVSLNISKIPFNRMDSEFGESDLDLSVFALSCNEMPYNSVGLYSSILSQDKMLENQKDKPPPLPDKPTPTKYAASSFLLLSTNEDENSSIESLKDSFDEEKKKPRMTQVTYSSQNCFKNKLSLNVLRHSSETDLSLQSGVRSFPDVRQLQEDSDYLRLNPALSDPQMTCISSPAITNRGANNDYTNAQSSKNFDAKPSNTTSQTDADNSDGMPHNKDGSSNMEGKSTESSIGAKEKPYTFRSLKHSKTEPCLRMKIIPEQHEESAQRRLSKETLTSTSSNELAAEADSDSMSFLRCLPKKADTSGTKRHSVYLCLGLDAHTEPNRQSTSKTADQESKSCPVSAEGSMQQDPLQRENAYEDIDKEETSQDLFALKCGDEYVLMDDVSQLRIPSNPEPIFDAEGYVCPTAKYVNNQGSVSSSNNRSVGRSSNIRQILLKCEDNVDSKKRDTPLITGMSITDSNNIFICDYFEDRVQLFDTDGNFIDQSYVIEPFGCRYLDHDIIAVSSKEHRSIFFFDVSGTCINRRSEILLPGVSKSELHGIGHAEDLLAACCLNKIIVFSPEREYTKTLQPLLPGNKSRKKYFQEVKFAELSVSRVGCHVFASDTRRETVSCTDVDSSTMLWSTGIPSPRDLVLKDTILYVTRRMKISLLRSENGQPVMEIRDDVPKCPMVIALSREAMYMSKKSKIPEKARTIDVIPFKLKI